MPNAESNKQKNADLADLLASGTQKHLSSSSTLAFDGGSFTPVQVETQLKLISSLRSDVQSAQLTATAKVAAEGAQLPALLAFMSAFVAFVKATFGNSPEVLADFGLPPKKARKPLTVEQKAAAKAKRDATRKARGTTSKKQKSQVKGDVTGVTITPTILLWMLNRRRARPPPPAAAAQRRRRTAPRSQG